MLNDAVSSKQNKNNNSANVWRKVKCVARGSKRGNVTIINAKQIAREARGAEGKAVIAHALRK